MQIDRHSVNTEKDTAIDGLTTAPGTKFFDEPHHQSLELLAARAIADGDFATAYKLADRRCRVPPSPGSRAYVLRAHAAFHVGERADAVSDLIAALEIAPEDIDANQRLLAWGNKEQQIQAANMLLGVETDFSILQAAILILRDAGRNCFGHVTAMNDNIEGWAVWNSMACVEVEIADDFDTVTTMIAPDPSHPLSAISYAANFDIPRPRSSQPQSIVVSIEGRIFYSTRVPANHSNTLAGPRYAAMGFNSDIETTVIIPVYSDYQATMACLDSLITALRGSEHCRVIVIDDATPDQRISSYLAHLKHFSAFHILKNRRNIGFIGSVNRALSIIPDGDILLLNSDTIVTPGFIDRLAATARSSPDIGTVMPLSNHSEFTSYPIPNKPNPIGSFYDIAQTDQIAARVNEGAVVDIPNGIGMCLYITRQCLAAVGGLSEDFYPGYLEDADFCLRARQHGFRNVCTPSVFIGHAGSRSFGRNKRTLVMRNLNKIERRFPKYRLECAAFMTADPLRRFREAIERAAPFHQKGPHLLLTGPGAIGSIARARGQQLESEAHSALILEVRHFPTTLRIVDCAEHGPQSIHCNLSLQRDLDWFRDYVRQLQPTCIEVFDPVNIPISLFELLLKLNIPYDMFIADSSLLGTNELPALVTRFQRADNSNALIDASSPISIVGSFVPQWRRIADHAARILVPTEEARKFAERFVPHQTIKKLEPPSLKRIERPSDDGLGIRLGMVPIRMCAQEQMLIHHLAASLKQARLDVSLTVLGALLNDFNVMRSGIFVTGAVDVSELDRAIRSYRLRFLFIGLARPLFGHPLQSAIFNSAVPVAYIDWSMGAISARKSDLAINPASSFGELVTALCDWLSTS